MSYNIPDDVRTAAEAVGMASEATGGGLDYMVKFIAQGVDRRSGMYVVLTDHEDAGSPDGLGESADVCIYADREWYSGVRIPCRTCREALGLIGRMSGNVVPSHEKEVQRG